MQLVTTQPTGNFEKLEGQLRSAMKADLEHVVEQVQGGSTVRRDIDSIVLGGFIALDVFLIVATIAVAIYSIT